MNEDYIDERGIKRRVYLPTATASREEGIPLDVYDIIEDRFEDASSDFRKRLYKQLWIRGLIEPSDFRKRNAVRSVRQALQSALSKDAIDIVRLVIGDKNDE